MAKYELKNKTCVCINVDNVVCIMRVSKCWMSVELRSCSSHMAIHYFFPIGKGLTLKIINTTWNEIKELVADSNQSMICPLILPSLFSPSPETLIHRE